MTTFCSATHFVKVVCVNQRNSWTMDVNHNACHLARSINISSRRGPLSGVNLSTLTGHLRRQEDLWPRVRQRNHTFIHGFIKRRHGETQERASQEKKLKKKNKTAHHFSFSLNQFSQLLILPVSGEATSPAGSPGEEQKLFIIPWQQLQPASRKPINILLSTAPTRPQQLI